MRPDGNSLQNAERGATVMLLKGWSTKKGDVKAMTPLNMTFPARLRQELPYLNTQSVFKFDFSQKAPDATAALNNVNLGINNLMAVVGIQLLIGTGEASNRVYRSFGVTVNDDIIYNGNSIVQLKIEADVLIDIFPTRALRDVGTTATESWDEAGMKLISPMRGLHGSLGVFEVSINLGQPIAGFDLTPDTFLSLALWGGIAQASA